MLFTSNNKADAWKTMDNNPGWLDALTYCDILILPMIKFWCTGSQEMDVILNREEMSKFTYIQPETEAI